MPGSRPERRCRPIKRRSHARTSAAILDGPLTEKGRFSPLLMVVHMDNPCPASSAPRWPAGNGGRQLYPLRLLLGAASPLISGSEQHDEQTLATESQRYASILH